MVFLVGAGPGDPRLLTLRAAELIASADVVVLDALVSPAIRRMIPAHARIVEAGKRASAHTLPQSEINRLLVDEARAGHRVVRLKGGDPFVFGRGGEEAEQLRGEGVEFEIVPGITSAIAGPAYAGIPVTHRSLATSLTLVTGHESDDSTGVPWDSLAQLDGTLVFLMGLGNLAAIAENLIARGKNPATPAAVISHATTPEQSTVTADLASITALVEKGGIQTPALIIVGEVVRLRETLNWFETRPLFGKRIVVTRAREQASSLTSLLEQAGASVHEFPAIEIVPPQSFESLDRVVAELSAYDVLIFTSANGVRFFFERLMQSGRDARALAGRTIAAVGQSTAAELLSRGVSADLVPQQFVSTALLPLLASDQNGVRTAVIRALEGRDELLEELRARGGTVDLGVAYETRATDAFKDELRDRIASGAIDTITFSSSSTVENFFRMLSKAEKQQVIDRCILASIGPVTSATLRRLGVEPDIEAEKATIESLVDAVIRASA